KTAQRGVWDLAIPGWIPDWFGNNGRSVLQPLFTQPGPGSSDYSGYNSAVTNKLIQQALTAKSQERAAAFWRQANTQILEDVPFVRVETQKGPISPSSRAQNGKFWILALSGAPTNVGLPK